MKTKEIKKILFMIKKKIWQKIIRKPGYRCLYSKIMLEAMVGAEFCEGTLI